MEAGTTVLSHFPSDVVPCRPCWFGKTQRNLLLSRFHFEMLIVRSHLFNSQIASRLSKKEAVASGKAGSIAEEVISSVRTVYAFNGQNKELERYEVHLHEARRINIQKGDSKIH